MSRRLRRNLRYEPPPQVPRVVVSMPTHRNPEVLTVTSLLRMQRYDMDRGLPWDCRIVRNSILPFSREHIVQEALRTGAEWIFWLDSDMTFPETTLERLLAHGKPFVAANCLRRQDPYSWTASKAKENLATSRDSTGLEETATIGLAVALTKTSIFEAIPRPWFDFVWRDGLQSIVGEDLYFCHKYVQTFGEGPLIDHDLSKEVGHVGELVVNLSVHELWKALGGSDDLPDARV